jgi:hypothetical protein
VAGAAIGAAIASHANDCGNGYRSNRYGYGPSGYSRYDSYRNYGGYDGGYYGGGYGGGYGGYNGYSNGGVTIRIGTGGYGYGNGYYARPAYYYDQFGRRHRYRY